MRRKPFCGTAAAVGGRVARAAPINGTKEIALLITISVSPHTLLFIYFFFLLLLYFDFQRAYSHHSLSSHFDWKIFCHFSAHIFFFHSLAVYCNTIQLHLQLRVKQCIFNKCICYSSILDTNSPIRRMFCPSGWWSLSHLLFIALWDIKCRL